MLYYTRNKSVLVDIRKSSEIAFLTNLHTRFFIRFVAKQPPWLIQCSHLHIAVNITFLAVFVEQGAEAGAAGSRIRFIIGTVP
jgi:hypothetical protein